MSVCFINDFEIYINTFVYQLECFEILTEMCKSCALCVSYTAWDVSPWNNLCYVFKQHIILPENLLWCAFLSSSFFFGAYVLLLCHGECIFPATDEKTSTTWWNKRAWRTDYMFASTLNSLFCCCFALQLSGESLGIFLSIKISFLFIYWRAVPCFTFLFVSHFFSLRSVW